MDTKVIKRKSGIPESEPLLSVDIGRGGIQQVLIYHHGEGIDEQTEAHLLLAAITSQLVLLDDAVKSASQ
jgi:hypothetical protein